MLNVSQFKKIISASNLPGGNCRPMLLLILLLLVLALKFWNFFILLAMLLRAVLLFTTAEATGGGQAVAKADGAPAGATGGRL